jgi:Tfp pilus assembly protein PilF
MSSLNLRLAAITVAVSIAIGGGIYLLHDLQTYRHASSLYQAAQKERGEKQFARAVTHYSQYLRYSPSDKKALFEFGMCLAEAHRYGEAFNRLEEVLRNGVDDSISAEDLRLARRKLVDVAMLMNIGENKNKWSHAEAHLKALLNLHESDITEELPALKNADPELELLLAECEIAAGKDSEGVLAFKDTIRRAPNQVEAYARLMMVLGTGMNRFAEADQICDLMLANNPKSAAALRYAAHYKLELAKYDKTQLDKVLIYANQLLELSPDDPKGLWLVGRCLASKGEWEKGLDALNRGIKAAPTDLAMYLAKADMLQRHGRMQDVIDTLKDGKTALKGTEGYPAIVFNLTSKLIATSQFAEAEQGIKEFADMKSNPPLVELLRANIDFAQSHWFQARTRLEKLLPELSLMPDYTRQANLMIAQCYGFENNDEKQLVAYRRILSTDPFFFPAREGIAEILIRSNQIEGALQEYRLACKTASPDSRALIALARTLMIKILRLPKTEQTPERWNEVSAIIDRAEKAAKGSEAVGLLKVQFLTAIDKPADAETLLANLRVQAPDRLEFFTLPALLAIRQNNWTRAEQYLDAAQAKFGTVFSLQVARLQYATHRYPGVKCKPELEKLAADTKSLNKSETAKLWNMIARVAISNGDVAWARSLAEKVAALDATDINSRYILVELALRSKDDPKAAIAPAELDRTLDELKSILGQGYLYYYGLAVRKSLEEKNDAASLKETLVLVNKAREIKPNWSQAAVLAGGIEEQLGNGDQALEDYLVAINNQDRRLEVIRRAVQLLLPRRRYDDAKALLEYLQSKDDGLTVELQQDKIAVGALTHVDLETVHADLMKTAKPDSKVYSDHLWHAQVASVLARRAKKEKPERFEEFSTEMLKSFQKAIDLNPKSEECYLVAVQFLADVGRPDPARPELARADAALAAAAQKFLVQGEQNLQGLQGTLALAHCYDALGRGDEAKKRFEAAVKSAPDDLRVLNQASIFYLKHGFNDLAEKVLRKIIESKSAQAASNLDWARRMLANVLYRRGEFKNFCAALDLIEENLRSGGGLPDDRRFKAQLLLSDPRQSKRREAIVLLNDMAERNEASIEDRFELAQLYLRSGGAEGWSNYRNQMLKLLGSRDTDPQLVQRSSLISALIDHNEFSEAEAWLKKLEADESAKNNIKTIELRASFEINRTQADADIPLDRKLENYKKAILNCVAFISNPDAEPKDKTQRIQIMAALMENFASRLQSNVAAASTFHKAADDLYDWYRGEPGARNIVVIGYLGRRGKSRDALELLTQSWDKLSVGEQTSAVVEIARNGSTVDKQFEALENLVDLSVKKNNEPLPLLLAKAELCSLQHKFEASEAVYRLVVKKDPKNYVAINNLAVLLAHSGQNLDEALRLAQRAAELAGPLSQVLDSEAVVHIARKEPQKAAADLQNAVADDPKPLYFFHLAQAQYEAGNKVKAKEALDTAKQKGLKPSALDASEKDWFERKGDELEAVGT